MSRPVVGIDLGTSNSVVATVLNGEAMVIPDGEGRTVFPSIASFPGGERVIVGHDARVLLFDAPERTIAAAKRLIGRSWHASEVREAARFLPFPIERGDNDVPLLAPGDQRLAIEQVQALILQHVKRVAEDYLGESVTDAVITVPANFNEAQRQATRLAGELAGLTVHRVLNEPTAAALAYGQREGNRTRIAVFDLGGGTFDITLLEVRGHVFEVLATAGDTFLGGEDLDHAIAGLLEQRARRDGAIDGTPDATVGRRLRAIAERLKIALTESTDAEVTVPELVPGSGRGATFRLSRNELRDTCLPILQQTFLVCDEALGLAGIAATEIDRLLLVGGSTRSPFVRETVEQYFFREAESGINPDEVVALGAAIFAHSIVPVAAGAAATATGLGADGALLDDDLLQPENDLPVPGTATRRPKLPPPAAAPPLLIDVIPRALGVRTAGGYTDILIPRNSSVPVREVRDYATSKDRQTTVRLVIHEGESRKAEENHLLGELVLDGLRPAPRGDVVIEVAFEVGVDGLLRISARDLETGVHQQATLHVAGLHDAETVARMRRATE